MKLTPLPAVAGFVILNTVAGVALGAWNNGAAYGWLVGVVSSAAVIGLLAQTHKSGTEKGPQH